MILKQAIRTLALYLAFISPVDVFAKINKTRDLKEEDEHRYIVKFKDGSSLFQQRLDENRRMRELSEDHAALEDTFLVPDNVEVMYLPTAEDVQKLSENEEVEYVEKGKCHRNIL